MAFNFSSFFNVKKSKTETVAVIKSGYSNSGGIAVNEETAMKASALYSGVIYISSQIAKLPWRIKDANNKIINDDVAFLLETQPNDELNSMDFRLLAVQTAIMKGNFYAEIERNAYGKATNLWPMNSDSVQLVRDVNGKLFYKTRNKEGGDLYLPPSSVFHIKNTHLSKDGLLGQGLIAYAVESLGIISGADAMAKGLFANGGMPSGVITVTGTLSPEAATRLVDSWNTAHGGRKSGGTAVLEEGAKYEPVQLQPDVLQFLESRKFSVLEIARFLRIPPTKLYDIDANSYNTQEQSGLEVATDTIHVWARKFEIETDVKILNGRYGGKKCNLDLYDIFKGDMKTRSDYFSKMINTGSITSNEIRDKEGFSPYDGGDKFWITTNNLTPVDRVDDVIDAKIKKDDSPSDSQNVPEDQDELEQAAINYLTGR